MRCTRCKEADTPAGHKLCDQCTLKEAARFLNVCSPTFSKGVSRRTGNRGGYRHVSEALAVEPEEVETVRAVYKEHGVGDIEHTPDGCPIFTSANQFQLATKARGMRTGRDGYDLPEQESGRRQRAAHDAVLAKWAAV